MKRGFVALVLVLVGVVMLVIAALASPLFVVLPDETGATIGLALMVGGAVLLVAGLIVRLTAPRLPKE
ncbi:hypothetical protein [Marisediminicola senii]|uniref:hypothetical protein n=1 Tax=Marisediminicola senii TaxID=2711233 RepID=UPI0013ED6818|nr:hypothetical protein [Marisediminicola senii]